MCEPTLLVCVCVPLVLISGREPSNVHVLHCTAAGFRDTMEQYSNQLRSALAASKGGLQLDVASAMAEVCAGRGKAAYMI